MLVNIGKRFANPYSIGSYQPRLVRRVVISKPRGKGDRKYRLICGLLFRLSLIVLLGK
jgi:hypothetical protein